MKKLLRSVFVLSAVLLLIGAIENCAIAQEAIHSTNSDLGTGQTDAGLPRGMNYPFSFAPSSIAPPPGLRIEMSLSPPTNIPTDPYELGKYGQIAVEYTRLAKLDGGDMGLAAQALHVAHHLLFYSLGLSSDINNDGMFILSLGLAHYQTGNSRAEPFVDAPFARFRFQSSPKDIFIYSEIETTMHFRSYISGMAGLGMRISPSLRVIGGFHHTEFVMPTEQLVQQVNGLEGIISWGM
jgi:hypothetical protein